MDRSVWLTKTSLCLLGCLIVGCSAGNKWQKYDETDRSITCYQCNSEYDPRCADPFDPYSLGTVNCSMKKPLEHMKEAKPILCRKTTQKVQGKVRVIRGCGYIADEKFDKQCTRRTGTHDVQVIYCTCTKNLCNAADTFTRPSTILTAFLSAAISILHIA